MLIATPFPLASGRYTVGPAMRRFGQASQGMPAEELHFQPDETLAATLRAKLAVLQRAPDECHLVASDLPDEDEAALRAALQETFRLLAAEHPAMAVVEEDGVSLPHVGIRLTNWSAPTANLELVGAGWPELGAIAAEIRAWLAGRQGLQRLGDGLALAVQEDLAIVRAIEGAANGAGSDLLEWLHACLPSSWVPAEKIGRSFGAVHQPVVHSEQLLASQSQIVRAMIHAGPFVRYVWAIHRDAELCHNPRLHRSPPWKESASPDDLARQAYFRVERQTTHGFPNLQRALFTIRYWVQPLTETAADPWRRERLSAALAGMDEAELRYKGLTDARDRLVAWLQSAPAHSHAHSQGPKIGS